MARATLTTQTIDQDGLTPTFAAASVDGASVTPGAFLVVKNGSGGSINVTIQTPETRAGLGVADLVVPVAAGAEAWIKPGQTATFARPSGGSDPGQIWVDFSAVTTVTVGAFAAA